MSGEDLKTNSENNEQKHDAWDSLSEEVAFAGNHVEATPREPGESMQDYLARRKQANEKAHQQVPTVSREEYLANTDAAIAENAKAKAGMEHEEVLANEDHTYEQSHEAFRKWEKANNTLKAIKEALDNYLQNTPEQNYELASMFGNIEAAGFEQPVSQSVGSDEDDYLGDIHHERITEVNPQGEDESNAEYKFRLEKIRQESMRHKQGDRLTDAKIAKAKADMEHEEVLANEDHTYGQSQEAFRKWEKARDKANLIEKLHKENKI